MFNCTEFECAQICTYIYAWTFQIQHTHNRIYRKAARQLNVIRCLSSLLDQDNSMAIFRAFIVSYGTSVERRTHPKSKNYKSGLYALFLSILPTVGTYENMLGQA